MTNDHDYDCFYGNAEVSAFGQSCHCHGHKSYFRLKYVNYSITYLLDNITIKLTIHIKKISYNLIF